MKTYGGKKGGACADTQKVPTQKPLGSKKIYLDLPGYRDIKTLEQDLSVLGAKLEHSFSKEVNCLISNKREAQSIDLSRQKSKGESAVNPSPFNLTSVKSLGDSPADSPGQGHGSRALTRGQRIANKANTTKNYGTTNILQLAQSWGIKVVSLDHALKWIQKEIDKLPDGTRKKHSASQDAKKTKQHRVKRLKGSFIKFEASNRHYRPVSKEFDEFPKIYPDSAFGSSPFERKRVHSRQNPLAVIERAEHEEEREDHTREDADAALKQLEENPHKSKKTQKKPVKNAKNGSNSDPYGVKIATLGEIRRLQRHRARVETKQGFCEVCETRYDDLHKHTRCDQHRDFVRNPDNYTSLDGMIKDGPNLDQFIKRMQKPVPVETKSKHPQSQESEYEVNLMSTVSSPRDTAKHKTDTGRSRSSRRHTLPSTSQSRRDDVKPIPQTPESTVTQSQKRHTRSQSRNRNDEQPKSVSRKACTSRRKLSLVKLEEKKEVSAPVSKVNSPDDSCALPRMESQVTDSISSISPALTNSQDGSTASECAVISKLGPTDVDELTKKTTRFNSEKRNINNVEPALPSVPVENRAKKTPHKRETPSKRSNLRVTPSKKMNSPPRLTRSSVASPEIAPRPQPARRTSRSSKPPTTGDVHPDSDSHKERPCVCVDSRRGISGSPTNEMPTLECNLCCAIKRHKEDVSKVGSQEEVAAEPDTCTDKFKRKVRPQRNLGGASAGLVPGQPSEAGSPCKLNTVHEETTRTSKDSLPPAVLSPRLRRRNTPKKRSRKLVKVNNWSVASEKSLAKLFAADENESEFHGFESDHVPGTEISFVDISEAEMTDDSEKEWIVNDSSIIRMCNGDTTPRGPKRKREGISDCEHAKEDSKTAENAFNVFLNAQDPTEASTANDSNGYQVFIDNLSPIKLPKFGEQDNKDPSSDWDDGIVDSILGDKQSLDITPNPNIDMRLTAKKKTPCTATPGNETFGSGQRVKRSAATSFSAVHQFDHILADGEMEKLWKTPQKSVVKKTPGKSSVRHSPRQAACNKSSSILSTPTGRGRSEVKKPENKCQEISSGLVPSFGPLKITPNVETSSRRSPRKWRQNIFDYASSIRTTSTPLPTFDRTAFVPESPQGKTKPPISPASDSEGKTPNSAVTVSRQRHSFSPKSGSKKKRRILTTTPRKRVAKFSLNYSGDSKKLPSKTPPIKNAPTNRTDSGSNSKALARIKSHSPHRPYAPPRSKVDWNTPSSAAGAISKVASEKKSPEIGKRCSPRKRLVDTAEKQPVVLSPKIPPVKKQKLAGTSSGSRATKSTTDNTTSTRQMRKSTRVSTKASNNARR